MTFAQFCPLNPQLQFGKFGLSRLEGQDQEQISPTYLDQRQYTELYQYSLKLVQE